MALSKRIRPLRSRLDEYLVTYVVFRNRAFKQNRGGSRDENRPTTIELYNGEATRASEGVASFLPRHGNAQANLESGFIRRTGLLRSVLDFVLVSYFKTAALKWVLKVQKLV